MKIKSLFGNCVESCGEGFWAGPIWLASADAMLAHPAIVTQSVDQTVFVGSTATLTQLASGAPAIWCAGNSPIQNDG